MHSLAVVDLPRMHGVWDLDLRTKSTGLRLPAPGGAIRNVVDKQLGDPQ